MMFDSAVKRYVTPVLAGLVVACVSAAALAQDASGTPKIFSPEPEYNFGKKLTTDKVKHDFVIKNVGDAPLKIGNVQTSCGCTVAELEKKTLAPDEETLIKATLSLKGPGRQHKSIFVNSNDPDTPRYQLSLEGQAIAPIMVQPSMLNYGSVIDDTIQEKTLKVYTELDDVTFNIKEIQNNLDFLDTEVTTLEEGKSYEIKVSSSQPLEEGRFVGRLNVMTDHPSQNSLAILIRGDVVGDLQISPQTLTLQQSENRTTKAFIRVAPGKVKDFKVTEVIPPMESIKTELLEQGQAYLVKLDNFPMDESMNGKSVKLKTDIEGKETIEVPIRIIQPRTAGQQKPLLRRPQ